MSSFDLVPGDMRDYFTTNPTHLTTVPFEHVYKEFEVEKARRLSQGGFGKVYLIKSKSTKNDYAAKYQKLTGDKLKRLVREEAEILGHLSSMRNPNKYVMAMHCYYEKNPHSLLVTEYLQGGELFAKINDRHYDLTENKCRGFTKQIVEGLNYIHSKGIVHLDIKPQNIMLTSRDQEKIKLIDFGLAKKLQDNGKVKVGFVGTVGFMAPEVLRCVHAEPSTDFFSLGVVLYMLLSGGYEPFWYKDEARTVKNTLSPHKEIDFNKNMHNVSGRAKDFMRGLLERHSEKRLFGIKCLYHDWLQVYGEDSGLIEKSKLRRYMARQRWKKALKAVRFMVKMQQAIPGKNRPEFHSQELPVTI